MDKGKNNLGGKPKKNKNSFFKKMAKKIFGFIPQPVWISSLFKTSGSDVELFNDDDHLYDRDIDEAMLQPPTKRPRISVDVTHPPGTFAIQSRDRSDRSQEDRKKEIAFKKKKVRNKTGKSLSLSFSTD